MNKYNDKHDEEILAGMTIRHDNGETQIVYATTDRYGDDDLGILATNPAYVDLHPFCDLEYYPYQLLHEQTGDREVNS